MTEDVDSFDNYLTKMSMNGSWGNGLTLAAAASLYGRSITIISDGGASFTVETPSTTSASTNICTDPMQMGYIGSVDSIMRNHYVS